MDRLFFALGSASALVAVAAGAFGAHGLRARLSPDLLAVFETGARYQMYHALALLAVGWAVTRWPGPWPVRAGWLFAVGTLLFSGSLYALALTGDPLAGRRHAAGRRRLPRRLDLPPSGHAAGADLPGCTLCYK